MRRTWAALAAFTICLLAVNESYYRANTRTPTYDEAWYLETSLSFYHALAAGHLGEFIYKYRTAFQTKAPLISVLPLPFYLIFGTSHHSALLVNSAFLVTSSLYLFLLVRRLFSPEAGFVAVVFYQTMPLVYGLSRTLMVEYGLSALVIVWLYYLVASDRLTRGPANFALGVVLGLGLLMKILFPAFIAGPLLLVWISRRREKKPPLADDSFRPWRLCARWPLAAIAVPGLAIAGTWYAFNWTNIVRFAWSNAYGEIAAGYGTAGLARQGLAFVNESIGFCYAVALVTLGAAALVAGPRKLSPQVAFLLSWVAPPLAAMAAGKNLEIRFAIPLLPAMAVLLAASVFQLARRRIVQVLLALLVAIFPLRLFAALSFPGSENNRPTTLGPFVLFSRDLGWAHPPDAKGSWGQQRIVDAIHRLDAPDAKPHYVVVGVEHPFLNANMLSYLDAYARSNLRFTSLGYAESSADRAIERIRRLDARFLVMAEGFHDFELDGFLNRINSDVQRRLEHGELPFRSRAEVDLGGRIKAVIYERVAG